MAVAAQGEAVAGQGKALGVWLVAGAAPRFKDLGVWLVAGARGMAGGRRSGRGGDSRPREGFGGMAGGRRKRYGWLQAQREGRR